GSASTPSARAMIFRICSPPGFSHPSTALRSGKTLATSVPEHLTEGTRASMRACEAGGTPRAGGRATHCRAGKFWRGELHIIRKSFVEKNSGMRAGRLRPGDARLPAIQERRLRRGPPVRRAEASARVSQRNAEVEAHVLRD